MPPQLRAFPSRNNSVLQVFCPGENIVVTSFESYLPDSKDIHKLSEGHPDLLARLCWLKEHHDYCAYLPKEHLFDGHLLEPLKRHKPKRIKKDGRWFVDDETRALWASLDNKLTSSIGAVGEGMLFDLEHCEPSTAAGFGFTRGHNTEHGLRASLAKSKNALVRRLAYLVYLVSIRYKWGVDLVDQEWWKALQARCGHIWVDSVWDAVYRQREARNFVGVVVRPVACSVRWLKSALSFGVPIWVWFPTPDTYVKLDGAFVLKVWLPTQEQVVESHRATVAKLAALRAESASNPSLLDDPVVLPAESCINPPTEPLADVPQDPQTHSELLYLPARLPPGTCWYESWEVFFRKREEVDENHLEVAPEDVERVWDPRAKNAENFRAPGKAGARVYVWEACDSGGFLRILQDRSTVAASWEFWPEEALIFDPRQNVWDYCPFRWKPAVEDGPPDDLDDDDLHVMDRWYTEPGPPATLPEANPSPLEFLYRRYGFLSNDPTTPPCAIRPFNKSSAYRIVGLEPEYSGEVPKHLSLFLSGIICGQLPKDICDLSETSPPDDMFQQAYKIRSAIPCFSRNFRGFPRWFTRSSTPTTPGGSLSTIL